MLRRRLPYILFFVVLVLILPRSATFNYDYRKGTPWKYDTFIAQFDFPIYKTDEQILEERAQMSSETIPYYRFSEEIVNENLRDVERLSFGSFSSVKTRTVARMRALYAQGILSDKTSRSERRSLNQSDDLIYVQRNKRAAKTPLSEVYHQTDARTKLLADISEAFPNVNVDSIFRAVNIYDYLVPNLQYDAQTTELVQAESVRDISPTQGFVPAGTLIVSKDETVTAEIEQMLDSYRREYEANVGYNGPKFLLWLGNSLVALVLMVLLILAVLIVNPDLLRRRNHLFFLMTVFLIATLCAVVVDPAHQRLYYFIPFTVIALWLKAFYPKSTVLTIYSISLLPLLIFAQDGAHLFVMFLIAGFVAVFADDRFGKGWKQFLTSLVTFLALLLTYLGFRLIDAVNGNPYDAILQMFLGSILTVAAFTLKFLFERVFNLVSESRLEEYADTDNAVLRTLESQAPGTFQHCLHVMNMAESAARCIGANVPLIRVGALYHDIGKIMNPRCFKENEALLPSEDGRPYHESKSPKESARDILRHVPDGLALAEKYHLPEEIRDFIRTHHGTGTATYFYNQYVNEGGDPADIAAFSYDGAKPRTREQIILMLCDSVEAAARTLKENTPKAFSELVERIVDTKLSEGQFAEADISIRELNAVKEELKTYLAQMYHERVAYPKRKK